MKITKVFSEEDFINQVNESRVYEVASVTPLEYAKKSSNRLGVNVYLKREDVQPIHSFKIRGAYNRMLGLSPSEKLGGVIAASAGNHAQGVALSAKRLGIKSKIVMPKTTPFIKVQAVKDLGADVVLYGDSYSEAAEYSYQVAEGNDLTHIHPFDDIDVIIGQATVGKEIVEQQPAISHVFVPIGGGGLISGVAAYLKNINPKIKVIGVQPEDSSAMKQSISKNRIVELSTVGIFADGVAVKKVGKNTFELCKKYVDEIITVNTDQICYAIQNIFEENRSIAEPAGALALAGIYSYFDNPDGNINAVAVCSGANLSFERLQFIAERTLIGSGRESLYAVRLPEKPGALLKFCRQAIDGHNIVEFGYRLHERSSANIFVGIKSNDRHDESFTSRLLEYKYEFSDLSSDEIVKEHVRYMIGGHSSHALNELIYVVEFPERPGALLEFLTKVSSLWNISLFHYRSLGGDIGKVLIGFEAENKEKLEKSINSSGFTFNRAISPAIDTFL
jgi:threonine dehydratase